jgi:uncharacterized membrane protein
MRRWLERYIMHVTGSCAGKSYHVFVVLPIRCVRYFIPAARTATSEHLTQEPVDNSKERFALFRKYIVACVTCVALVHPPLTL